MNPQEVVVLVTTCAVGAIISATSWVIYPDWCQKVREASFLLEQGWYNGSGWRLRAIVLIDKTLGG